MLRKVGYAAIITVTAVAFAIGSAATADAKGKKKAAEAAPPPIMPACQLMPDKQVCGSRGGLSFSYKNACYAQRDGAKVVADKACATKAAKAGGKKKAGKKMGGKKK